MADIAFVRALFGIYISNVRKYKTSRSPSNQEID